MRTRIVAGVALALAIATGALALDKPAAPPAAAGEGFLTVAGSTVSTA